MALLRTFSKLARTFTRGNQPANIDDQPSIELHQMTVTHVDTFSGVVSVQFPDIDGAGAVVSGVRYMRSYSSANPPQVGDVVWAHKYGPDLLVAGQHVVPTNFVTVS